MSSLLCRPMLPSVCLRASQAAVFRGAHVLPSLPNSRHRAAGYQRQQARAVMEDLVVTPDSRQGPGGEPAAAGRPPADIDREKFQQHWSVEMWRTFYPQRWLDALDNEAEPLAGRAQGFVETLREAVASSGLLASTDAARYWAYHLGRSGFFLVQGMVGLLAARAALGGNAQSGAMNRMEEVFRRGWAGPVTEALLTYYQDWTNIQEGKYALPWDMTTSGHRQFNPLFVAQRGAAFVREAADTLKRRDAGVPQDVWLRNPSLPDYFQKTFHYQTDGWMSAASARVYETSTETLFVGRQDAMQRSTLVHMHGFMADKIASEVQALEVAAGTGRFATFVKDNYPTTPLTVSDLSPFYLAAARDNLRYWKSMRAPNADLGGVDGTGATFVQAAAEALGAPDASYDLVYCVYLFHELPADVRAAAAAEMARVLKPGGMLILTDSAQLGDREALDATLGNFESFNEPFYKNYVSTEVGALFEAAGLVPDSKVVASTTKSLSFRKPLAGEHAALENAFAAEPSFASGSFTEEEEAAAAEEGEAAVEAVLEAAAEELSEDEA